MAKKRGARSSRTQMLRLLFVLCVTIVLLIVVFGRVFFIKVVHGEEYQQMAEQQQVNSTDVVIPALRGSIYDRNGNVLAESTRVYTIILDCQVLIDAETSVQNSTIEQILSTLGLTDENIIRQYMTDEYYHYRYLKLKEGEGISVSQMEEIQAGIDAGKVTGVWFEEDENRVYINDSLAAHIVGFNGNYGVEQYYDEYLSGVQGRKMVVANAGGSFVEEYIAAQNGNDLTLTIDSKVQYYMEQILQQGVNDTNAYKGCAICMNPKTGEIYGLVNMPTFNLNNNTEIIGMSQKYMEQNPDTNAEDYYSSVWTNFATSLTYEPGSTFKPVFASAALNEGAISPNDTFVCNGVYQIYERQVQCDGAEVHGTETIADIILNSCNVGMTQISERMGSSKWLQYQEPFGLGQLTGIDLAGEAGDSDSIIFINWDEAETLGTANGLGPFQKATTAFGQGFRTTPLQLITAFSAVINGGEYVRPYTVSQINDSNGSVVMSQTKDVLRYTISEEVSQLMREYMYGTVSSGTGTSAQVPGYEIGGKTGTAEKLRDDGTYETDKYTVSFIGFTPIEDPEVVLLVILDETDQNVSSEAARLAGQMFEKILPVLGIYPDETVNQNVVSPNADNSSIDLGNDLGNANSADSTTDGSDSGAAADSTVTEE